MAVIHGARQRLLGFTKSSKKTRSMSLEEKLELTGVGCIQQPSQSYAKFCLIWFMDKFLRFQHDFHKAQDVVTYYEGQLKSKDNFDRRYEFAGIVKTFVEIIKDKVMSEAGAFYCSDDTVQNPPHRGFPFQAR